MFNMCIFPLFDTLRRRLQVSFNSAGEPRFFPRSCPVSVAGAPPPGRVCSAGSLRFGAAPPQCGDAGAAASSAVALVARAPPAPDGAPATAAPCPHRPLACLALAWRCRCSGCVGPSPARAHPSPLCPLSPPPAWRSARPCARDSPSWWTAASAASGPPSTSDAGARLSPRSGVGVGGRARCPQPGRGAGAGCASCGSGLRSPQSDRALTPPSLRFGDGYAVRVWVSEEGGPHAAVSACLQRHFPGTQLKVVRGPCIGGPCAGSRVRPSSAQGVHRPFWSAPSWCEGCSWSEGVFVATEGPGAPG